MVDADELLGIAEIAAMFDVAVRTVHSWRERGGRDESTKEAVEFPAPIATLTMGVVYLRSDVEAWAKKTGRL